MSKFRFCGDPATDANGKQIDNSNDGFDGWGLNFFRKTYTEVKDEALAAKLRGNNHFEEQKKQAKTKTKTEE